MEPIIDHVNRYVSDVEAHVLFYSKVLGYELIGKGIKGNGFKFAILKGSNHELFISENENVESQGSLRHIGYSVDDVESFIERLQRDGLVHENCEVVVKQFSKQFYLEDPDGNNIDIIQWTNRNGFYQNLSIT